MRHEGGIAAGYDRKRIAAANIMRREGAKCSGFREALRGIAREQATWQVGLILSDEGERKEWLGYTSLWGGALPTVEDLSEFYYDEWFGYLKDIVPLAYRIDAQENDPYYRFHIHVYEWEHRWIYKASRYGNAADLHEVAEYSLHVVDTFGNTVALYNNDLLEPFMSYYEPHTSSAESVENWNGLHRQAREAAVGMPDRPILAQEPTDKELWPAGIQKTDLGRNIYTYSDLVARRILSSKSTLHWWVHKRGFPVGFTVGRFRFWYADDVTKWLEQNKVRNKSPPQPVTAHRGKISKAQQEREMRTLYEAMAELGLVIPGELA